LAYECFVGEIPDGMLVCHTCDVPKCVNPDHLFLGTSKDNVKDMIEKGRKHTIPREKHHFSKLTNEQVAELVALRRSGEKLKDLAKIYGITYQTVSDIYLKEIRDGTRD